MPKSIQTNKEFVEAAGIAERDAFIAVAIRRIVAQMTEIPVREMVAERGFEDQIQGRGFYTDWDECLFLLYLEEYFDLDIDQPIAHETAEKAGYSNWFYCPGTTFGGWVKLAVEVVLAPVRDKITPPDDWPGLESSDLNSDAIAPRSPAHNVQFFLNWGCLGLLIVVAIVLLVSKFIEKS